MKQTIPQQKIEDGEEVMYEAITAVVKRRHLNTIFSSEHRKEILRYIYCHQNEDGGWGLYIGGHSTMFCTALNYICMRLLGVGPDGGLNNACERGRKWILDRGGVTTISSWGKTWLSILRVYEWSGCQPMPPEFWLFPSYFPIHPDIKSEYNIRYAELIVYINDDDILMQQRCFVTVE
ncbi:Lupeol synthase [Gossypium arboreum]|uniref:Lupeol synthase n=1 Tax=Gossypium arboreum TaxID=29729 RepID=A0A0B0MB59_GOSAR|nr:Lupeol synthase [Gossypium arboreum]